MVLLVLSWIIGQILYHVGVDFQFGETEEGPCFATNSSSVGVYAGVGLSWYIISILVQRSMLTSFVYPILKKTLRKNRQDNCRFNLIRRVKKAIVLALICVETDIATFVLYMLVVVTNKPND